MASGDWTDLATRACRMARRDPTDTTGDLLRAKEFVNEALLSTLLDGTLYDVLEAEGTFSVTSAADTYTYGTISATLDEILTLVNDTDGQPLVALAWAALEQAALSTQDAEATGQPGYWAKWGQGSTATVRLFPKPDATRTLRWFGRVTVVEMSVDGSPNPIPLAWRHRILVPFAAARLLRMESGFAADSEAAAYEAQYEQARQLFKVAHGSAKKPNEGVISPGYGREWPAVDAGVF